MSDQASSNLTANAAWRRLVLAEPKPSEWLQRSLGSGGLAGHTELLALCGCAQDPHWHPEGDAWRHTLLSMDAFAGARLPDERENYIVGLAVLCHDFGKPLTSAEIDGRITSRGHEAAGEAPARAFLARIGVAAADAEEIIPLVRCHMRPDQLYIARSGASAVRRLERAVNGRMDRLVRVARADKSGRGTGPADFPAGEWLLQRASEPEK